MIRSNLTFFLFLVLCFWVSLASTHASANVVLFDVDKRKKELQEARFKTIKEWCMASNYKKLPDEIPEPVKGLKTTDGYGSDRSLSNVAWFLMIHSGRALAGETKSEAIIRETLLKWTDANALHETQEIHDAYYALKRALLPMIVSYTIVQDGFSKEQQKKIERWFDPLVRRVDKIFDGDVDHNNHRYLGDSVLTLWGDLIGDQALYHKGKERFEIALKQMEADGALPLETRRGTRAVWYIRQSIANLSLIAEVYRNNGENLYALEREKRSLRLMTNYFVSAVNNPLILLPHTSENYIPGPDDYFLQQDLAVLKRRGERRHYMAFAELYHNRFDPADLSNVRLKHLMEKTGFQERPLIDDFVGGNATCFWGQP